MKKKLAKDGMSKYAFENLAFMSETMLYLMTAAVNDAVAAAPRKQPQTSSNLINAADRQCTCLQEMAKEVVLYYRSLAMGPAEQAISNRKPVEKTKEDFEDAHYDSLHGSQLLGNRCESTALSMGGDSGYRSSLIRKPADYMESYTSTADVEADYRLTDKEWATVIDVSPGTRRSEGNHR